MVRPILFVVVLLVIALQPWWDTPPQAMAEEPPQEKLALTIAPPILLADESTHSVIYLQLVGADGVPRLASQDTLVSLVSSDSRIVRVPNRVHIPAGKSYTIAPLTTTSATGNVVVTAVIPGRAPVSAVIEIVSALDATSPFRLALYAAPGMILPGGQPPAKLAIMLLGANGRMVPAPESLNVVLSSSDPDVVRVAERVTIPKGEHFAILDLEPMAAGSATLSAVGSGFVSEFIEIRVVEPGETADALVLYLSPPVLSSGAGSHRGVIVQAIDTNGIPVYFPCTQVHLASSSPLSAEITPVAEVTCGRNAHYASGTLTIGALPGTLTITAAATGLRPAVAILDVQGRLPAQLKAYLAPQGLLRVEDTPGFAAVQVLDGNGVPVNLHDGIPVTLVGGGETFQDEVMIPKGQSFVTLGLGDLQPASQVELWFVNPNLSSAPLTVKFHTLVTSVQVIAPEEPLFPGDQSNILVRVQSAGIPLPQAKLAWKATNGTLSDTALETDQRGEGRAVFVARDPGDGTIEVTVNKVGYTEVKTEAMVAVVAAIEPDKPSPRLLGIPVWYLFIAMPAVLLAYLLYKFLPGFKRRQV
ncbi:MAG: hypothetical protein V3U79_09795 [Dehalococcoidia bacterium]